MKTQNGNLISSRFKPVVDENDKIAFNRLENGKTHYSIYIGRGKGEQDTFL